MVVHRIELCIAMVRMAIEFVMSVAETVVTVQERNTEPLGSLHRTKRKATNDKRLTMAMKNDFTGGGGGDSTAMKTILL
ncbi:hypothetical protein Ahy_A10g049509 isoform B [Arachis hypogaea]|uniref:Secreted protein n=1 Tax=Arachis hypogaea TaxID=3818 RepID=A0A445B7C2_ARAHY|nr:hypothetical protein Ahy_A10g049509 isoform B [Arachis hypogaea]